MFVLTTGFSFGANTMDYLTHHEFPTNNNLSSEWQEYAFTDGVLIEYRMQKVNSEDYGRQVNMLLFRFTNTTDQVKDCSWSVKIERNDVCYNCQDLGSPENVFTLQLNPNQIIEGNSSNLITRSELNIFGNFVKLVPGMTTQKLTGFELIDLTIK